jgi:hypothetical protein
MLEDAVARFGTASGDDPDVEGLVALDTEVRRAFAVRPSGARA